MAFRTKIERTPEIITLLEKKPSVVVMRGNVILLILIFVFLLSTVFIDYAPDKEFQVSIRPLTAEEIQLHVGNRSLPYYTNKDNEHLVLLILGNTSFMEYAQPGQALNVFTEKYGLISLHVEQVLFKNEDHGLFEINIMALDTKDKVLMAQDEIKGLVHVSGESVFDKIFAQLKKRYPQDAPFTQAR